MYTDAVNKIQITGGSINSTFGKRPVNASGQSVYKTTITLPVAEVATVESLTIKQGSVTIPCNITAMNTDANGKLYIYLPASESQTTATIKVGSLTNITGSSVQMILTYLRWNRLLSVSSTSTAHIHSERPYHQWLRAVLLAGRWCIHTPEPMLLQATPLPIVQQLLST